MNSTVKPITYDRNLISTGILHIGVGNFHRAHEEYYTNLLLEQEPSQLNWAISGAMLLPFDEKLYKNLDSQNGEYTLTVCGRDDKDSALWIGALKEVMWAKKDPERIIDKIADKDIKIISLTITEGGYNIDKANGEFILTDEAVAHDIADPKNPISVFGYVAEGLRRRRDAGNGGITILSCDNLQHNGNTAKKAFMAFFEAQDLSLAEWVKENVTFPNSMVDRITPATRPEDIERLNRTNHTEDKAPVYCEDFIQWVIEDNFAAGRPEWEKVGVQFTDDVTAYENMKLSLLNASHTLLSYPSFLSGYRKVDDAMHDPYIRKLVEDFMNIDITPYVPAPGDTDLDEYKRTLVERFGNKSVSDQISRLCFDGISKFPVYIVPNLDKMLRDGKDLTRMAFLIAAYREYLKYHKDDNGVDFEIAEPWLTEHDRELIASDDIYSFLKLSPFTPLDFTISPDFLNLYEHFCKEIHSKGAYKTLKEL